MADKNDVKTVAEKVEFGTWEPEEKVNPYVATIDDLIARGENASVSITVSFDEVSKRKLLVSKAANAKNKTARLRVVDDSGVKYGADENGEQIPTGGSVKLTYTLTDRHKARRRKGDTGAQVPADA